MDNNDHQATTAGNNQKGGSHAESQIFPQRAQWEVVKTLQKNDAQAGCKVPY